MLHHPREQAGFTLVELMVVVLMIGILLAIAIPTFLSLTTSARASGAEADLTTALTDENAFHLQYGTYGTGSTSPSIALADGGLNWTTCTSSSSACIADTGNRKDVYVLLTTSNGYDGLVLGAAGSGSTDYWEYETQDPTSTLPAPTYLVTNSTTPPTPAAFAASANASWKAAGG